MANSVGHGESPQSYADLVSVGHRRGMRAPASVLAFGDEVLRFREVFPEPREESGRLGSLSWLGAGSARVSPF